MFDFKLPDIGEGVHEGEIVRWLVKPGDVVQENQPIVEVMTDKATVELTSPRAGRIARLGGQEGAVLKVGELLVAIEEGAAASQAPEVQQAVQQNLQGPPETRDTTLFEGLGEGSLPAYVSPEARAASRGGGPGGPGAELVAGKVLATPATRALARQLGVELAGVRGSGPGGRVTSEDVQRAATRTRPQMGATRQVMQPLPAARVKAAEPLPHAPDGERVPIRALRRRIYENMRRSKDMAAHFTYVEECDVGELLQLREAAKGTAERQGVKLAYLPFIVKAAVAALKRYPDINAHVDDAKLELVRYARVNIGIAVQTERGLMVFVVHDADKKGILQIAREMQDLGELARQGKIKPEDLQGSTFTITSLGKTGGLLATPIINYPEVAIMGVHKIEKRAVVNAAGEIVAADRMNLSFSFDHRVIDGAVGAEFAHALIRYIEDPKLLLLESMGWS